ncbi:hypothetical protein FOB82_02390 [Corynebacterium xerosis]|uniref:Uncharacterized protein n=1 Tax=Corynebacterium xerosis TaxID=1725 RepID=A0A6B8TEK4_9CORY|nr:hypothetical protein [Corynebacterium xerosis]QGS33964.1 hypothetical protein FOB82_02390 [Corynebacterium xerosis]
MTTITLNIQWRGHQPGDTITVDEPTAEWLRRTGATASDSSLETAPATAPELDTPDDPDPAPAPEAPAEAPAKTWKRPARTAPVATWRAYAEAQGIDPKGLTKAEIIAATKGA